ncbi:MAG: hypothetical protein HC915_21595 [Anaerolineae bacterium]|nr:hypothetical protein [Anaerolineae bacterium]
MCRALVVGGWLEPRSQDGRIFWELHPALDQSLPPVPLEAIRERLAGARWPAPNATPAPAAAGHHYPALALDLENLLGAAEYSAAQGQEAQRAAFVACLERVEPTLLRLGWGGRWETLKPPALMEPESSAAKTNPNEKLLVMEVSSATPPAGAAVQRHNPHQIAYDEALARNNRPEIARTAFLLAGWLAEEEQAPAALYHYREALAILLEMGDLRRALVILEEYATYALRVAGAEAARDPLSQALNIAEQLQDEDTRARLTVLLGDCHAAAGRRNDAANAYKTASKLAKGLENALTAGLALGKLGRSTWMPGATAKLASPFRGLSSSLRKAGARSTGPRPGQSGDRAGLPGTLARSRRTPCCRHEDRARTWRCG